ncbi:MAG TPA: hypothetical protein VLA03_07120 [Draconibacterium sp.]|nr:hypothetical protein [Draconibacterium sp.]
MNKSAEIIFDEPVINKDEGLILPVEILNKSSASNQATEHFRLEVDFNKICFFGTSDSQLL